jgi:hypothetical protein
MNKKGNEVEKRLKESKIIPEEYLKSLEISNFYSGLQKKDDDFKLFVQELNV